MSVARTFDLPSPSPASSGRAVRPATGPQPVTVALIVAILAVLLGGAYYFGSAGIDGYPDPTQQWTD